MPTLVSRWRIEGENRRNLEMFTQELTDGLYHLFFLFEDFIEAQKKKTPKGEDSRVSYQDEWACADAFHFIYGTMKVHECTKKYGDTDVPLFK